MTFHSWFPTVVYSTKLDLTSHRRAMIEYVDKFNVFNEYSMTGDTVNDFQISSKPTFSWLNKEVYNHCLIYLKEFGVDTDSLDLFSSKSWPVVCNPEYKTDMDNLVIQRHSHPNSHLSVVFYLQTDSQSGGELKLYSSHDHPIHHVPLRPYVKDRTYYALDCIEYNPEEGGLIIFPSSVDHEVNPYHGQSNRYSITYDIIITSKADLDTDNEMCVINPKNWLELKSDV